MEEKKKTDEAIEKLKNAKCAWPGCGKKQMMSVTLPLMEQKDGKIVPAGLDKEGKGSIGIPVPMCEFHFHLAPFCTVVKQGENLDKIGFMAPVKEVELTKTTIAAMVFTGELQKFINAKTKEDERQKEFEKKLEKKKDENKTKDAEPEADKPADSDSNK